MRRFPPPWSVEKLDACFVVRGQDHGRESSGTSRGIRLTGNLALLGQPMMFGDPFFGFRFRNKLTEVARGAIWPRHFDAPIIPPLDRC
jgi:hypothetical protein